MRLLNLEINGFKSFAKKTNLEFHHRIVSIVGPNGSGKSNVVEAFRFVLGEQSMKSMRGKGGSDLIFKGSKNLPKGSIASVTIYFDNKDRVFKLSNDNGEDINLNFDTISITRSVYSDGLNKYLLNNSEVRLKDINNLLSSLNIGSSGHHIISQGEADRILNANLREKREMIEDALGLKVFQYKIREAERKMLRANENLKEVIMLKRENLPHLSFLKRQIEKFEKMKELKIELTNLYNQYLKNQSIYLEEEKNALLPERENLKRELERLDILIRENTVEDNNENNPKLIELNKYENDISNLRRLKGEIDRKLGRIEGIIEARKWKVDKREEVRIFDEKELTVLVNQVDNSIDEILKLDDLSRIKNNLINIKDILHKFLNSDENHKVDINFENETEALEKSKEEISLQMTSVLEEEERLLVQIQILKKELALEVEQSRDKERERFSLRVSHQEVNSKLSLINVKLENLSREIDIFNEEIREGEALIGEIIYEYKNMEVSSPINKEHQEELKRSIERIKIKLEDSGLSNMADIEKEYEEVNNRDLFLTREIEDISNSITSLEQLILDLKNKIDIEFKSGVSKINEKFNEFFAIMFGGGYAKLAITEEVKKKKIKDDEEGLENTEEEEEIEEGIDIDVSLPHKKVKELHSLSGGERSLTSIALLFAMSSVNPPPFLILDETDAALDEANSRRYGDMLERLGEKSQLIVVTHNRETMSRAGILYGVTVGADGASKLLSIKFEEAQAIAK